MWLCFGSFILSIFSLCHIIMILNELFHNKRVTFFFISLRITLFIRLPFFFISFFNVFTNNFVYQHIFHYKRRTAFMEKCGSYSKKNSNISTNLFQPAIGCLFLVAMMVSVTLVAVGSTIPESAADGDAISWSERSVFGVSGGVLLIGIGKVVRRELTWEKVEEWKTN